jgi:hypothetical protein
VMVYTFSTRCVCSLCILGYITQPGVFCSYPNISRISSRHGQRIGTKQTRLNETTLHMNIFVPSLTSNSPSQIYQFKNLLRLISRSVRAAISNLQLARSQTGTSTYSLINNKHGNLWFNTIMASGHLPLPLIVKVKVNGLQLSPQPKL